MTSKMQKDSFNINEVLACPDCHGALGAQVMTGMLQCVACGNKYPIKNGIYHLMPSFDQYQKKERVLRDQIAQNYASASANELLQVIGLHHCIPVMEKRAGNFRRKFSSNYLILDVGGGWGWPWRNTTGPLVFLIDFSLANLIIAKKLLSEKNRVVLIWGDASHLPIRSRMISGVWSAQATQCFPQPVMELFKSELRRVLKPDHFSMEIYNVNQNWLRRVLQIKHFRVAEMNQSYLKRLAHSLAWRISAKDGQRNGVELKLSDAKAMLDWFQPIRPEAQVEIGYSELFFHPNLKFRPPVHLYPEKLEHLLTKLFPSLARLMARQIHINLDYAAKIDGK